MTIARFKIKDVEAVYGIGEIPVTIVNPKNNKKIVTDLEVDTGSTITAIPSKVSRTLGIDLESGIRNQKISSGDVFYTHNLLLQVANLKPITTPVQIPSSKTNIVFNVMGLNTMKQFKRVEFSQNEILFEDFTPTPLTTVKKNAILVDIYTSFYGYPRWYTKRI